MSPRGSVAQDMMRRVQAQQMRRFPSRSIGLAPAAGECNSDADCPRGYSCKCGTGPSGEVHCFCIQEHTVI